MRAQASCHDLADKWYLTARAVCIYIYVHDEAADLHLIVLACTGFTQVMHGVAFVLASVHRTEHVLAST